MTTREDLMRMDLREGSVVIAKLGDPSTGWIPPPEVEKKFMEVWEAAMKERGLTGKVTCIVWSYAIDFQILQTKPQETVLGM